MGSKVSNLIDIKTLRVVRLFLNNPDEIYHIQKISKNAKVPLGTTFRLMQKMTKEEIVKTIPVGKLKLYQLNKKMKKELELLK